MNNVHSNDIGTRLSASVDQLAKDGFVLLDQLGDDQLVASILAVSSRKAQAIRDARGDNEIGIGSAAGYEEIVQRSVFDSLN